MRMAQVDRSSGHPLRRGILAALILSLLASCSRLEAAPSMEAGVLDLRSHSFSAHPIIDLDGAWEFYWHRFLMPGRPTERFPERSAVTPDAYLSVPDAWNGNMIAGQELAGEGYATYRLRVLLPHDSGSLALKMLDAGSSYRLWANGRLIGEVGHPGIDEASTVPSYRTATFDLGDPGSELEIILHVSNFQHRKGGLWERIKLGTAPAIHAYRDRLLVFEGFLAGTLVVMGLYHLALYALRRRELSLLWFGLLCLAIAVRTALVGERILHAMLPDVWWLFLLKAEYITMMLGMALFVLYLGALFPRDIPAMSVRLLVAMEAVLVGVVLIMPSQIFTHIIPVNHVVLALGMLVGLGGMGRAIGRRREGSVILLFSVLLFAGTVVNDMLYNQQIISTFQMAGAGLFAFILSQSFVLSLSFARAFSMVEALSKDLGRQNVAYSRFVPTEFLRLLEKENIVDIQLGDQIQKEMSVLFVDIRSFTTLSEKMTPAENFDFLNEYLGRIGPLIRQSGGFIDKYLGDGLMALFPDRPEQALHAALEIQRAVGTFNEDLLRQGRPAIAVGSAIHTGPLMLGTVGERERMDGTVISDAVNLASRLEGLTRNYGCAIVISEETLQRLEDPTKYCWRFLGKVRVRGKTEPVSVFEVFDLDAKELRIVKQVTRTEFEKGVVLLHSGDYAGARLLFEGILRANPDDQATRFYLAKIDSLLQRRRLQG